MTQDVFLTCPTSERYASNPRLCYRIPLSSTRHSVAALAVCHHVVSVCQDFSQPFLSPLLSTIPPPPPPPPDELEPPPKPPFADEEEEEEMLLRETCLMSMANKRVAATEVGVWVVFTSTAFQELTCLVPCDAH